MKSIETVQGWIDCFERAKLKKVIFAGGVNEAGEIEGKEALDEAFKAGEQV